MVNAITAMIFRLRMASIMLYQSAIARRMGRDFWRALYRYGDHALWASWSSGARAVRFDNKELNRLDAFADAVPVYFGRAPSPKTPGIATWRSFRENFLDKDADKEILDSNPFPNRPLLMRTTGKRVSSGTPPAKAF